MSVSSNEIVEVFGQFEFGLSAAQEVRAAALHDRAVIVDMVHQGAGGDRLFNEPEFAAARARLVVAFEHPLDFMAEAMRASCGPQGGGGKRLRALWDESGVTAGMMYIDVGGSGADGPGANYGRAGADMLAALPWLSLARTTADIRAAKAQGRHCVIGYCQPVMSIPVDFAALDHAYELGLRVLMLTYNAADAVGAGCTAVEDNGLTAFGRDVVRWCNERGVLVDTSHCGPRTTLDACRASQAPVLANHTAAAGVFEHERGKSDDVLRAIADTGGLVGVVAVPFFLSPAGDADIRCMLRHIEYIAALIGAEHVGIGTDWPLSGPTAGVDASFGARGLARIGFDANAHRIQAARNLIGFDDYRDFPNITRGLVAAGFNDDQIIGILGANFLDVFARVCDPSGI